MLGCCSGGGDLCAGMRARVADSVIAAAQPSLCQRIRPGDVQGADLESGEKVAGVAVKGSKHPRNICVSVTHARTHAWLEYGAAHWRGLIRQW